MLTVQDLKTEFRLYSSDDAWGDVMGFFFRVAESLHWHHGEDCPPEWGFRPGIGRGDDPEEDYIAGLLDQCSPDVLVEFGNILDRVSRLLKAQGRNY